MFTKRKNVRKKTFRYSSVEEPMKARWPMIRPRKKYGWYMKMCTRVRERMAEPQSAMFNQAVPPRRNQPITTGWATLDHWCFVVVVSSISIIVENKGTIAHYHYPTWMGLHDGLISLRFLTYNFKQSNQYNNKHILKIEI